MGLIQSHLPLELQEINSDRGMKVAERESWTWRCPVMENKRQCNTDVLESTAKDHMKGGTFK
jgi:hypothetical protein